MQIIIDIPENSYKATCNGCMLPPDVENVVEAIKNGTPLPKVFDKIRAEINTMCGDIETIADILAIIDKYKSESEDEE